MAEKLNIAMVFGNVRRSRIIGGPPPIQVTGKVLTFSGWSLVGSFYEYSLYDSKITAGSIVEVVPSRHDIATVQAAQIMPEADVTAGYVKLYCKNAPAADIDITINIHTGLSTTPAKGFFIASGADGKDGTDGTNGVDGDSAYVYIAYASDDSGTGFTTTFNPALDYIAILATDTEILTPAVGDFAGLWKNYKGADGQDASSDVQDLTGKSKYGALYNWYAVDDPRNIANTGWHVMTWDDMLNLINYVTGGNYTPTDANDFSSQNYDGGELKEEGITHWQSPNLNATNEFGFSAVGSGNRNSFMNFVGINEIVSFYTSDREQSSPTTNDIGGFTIFNSTTYGYKIIFGFKPDSELYQGHSLKLVSDTPATGLADGTTGAYTGNDGKVYKTVVINEKWWLAENLAETRFRTGERISFHGATYEDKYTNAEWAALTTEAMCWYNDDETNGWEPGTLTETIETIFENLDGKEHNALGGLQGGDAGEDEFYHLTADEKTAVENLSADDKKDWIEFEFADVEAGTAKEYVLDIKALIGYTINSAVLQTNDGTLTGVNVKIGATAVTGLSSVTVTTAITETAATAANVVVAGDKVTISITTGYTGTPTLIRGKINLTRT